MADEEKLAEEKVVLKTSESADETSGKEPACDLQVVTPEISAGKPDLGPRYEILELLGQGGMGSVYKVFDKELNSTLAAKVIRSELAADAQAIKRFEREIKAASELSHGNLVSVYGQGRSGSNVPYLIMDYIDGQSLSDVLKKEGPLSFDRAIEIFLQTCGALEYAHKANVIHRDLKPSNIMLKKTESGDDDVRVLDFGIAKVLASEGSDFSKTNLTQTGDVFGSPLYMSPEQCQNNPQDARSDIYSFGCVMYEALTGVQPFFEDNPVKIILKHMNYEPPLLSTKCKDDPRKAAFDGIVQKCLEKSPGDRYQNIGQLVGDLEAIKSGKPASVKVKQGKPKKQPLGTIRTLALAVIGIVLIVAAEVVLTQIFQNTSSTPNTSDAFKDATELDGKSYTYFVKGDYEKAAPLLEFGIATYRERVQADKESGDLKQQERDEVLLTENIQHLGKCYLEIARKAQTLNHQEEATTNFKKALEKYREALKFWMRYNNVRGTMASEAVGEYEFVLKQLHLDAELARLNEWRSKSVL